MVKYRNLGHVFILSWHQYFGSALIVCGSGYGSSILDEFGSGYGSSADPDSGKTMFSAGKEKENFFSSNYSHIKLFLCQVLCLKHNCIENSTKFHIFPVLKTNFFLLFWADFTLLDPHSQCGSGYRSPSNADPMRIRIRSTGRHNELFIHTGSDNTSTVF
jgi:hypothetical protein